ncbi:MAG: SDR family NAD(P)-dependent oxidoreductase, partial [Pseudomonadota bacterium]
MGSNTSTITDKTVLVIGATGGLGSAVAEAFLKQGWRVRALTRRPEAASFMGDALVGIDWQLGDAMSQSDVVRAAQGVEVIVHAANPPQY